MDEICLECEGTGILSEQFTLDDLGNLQNAILLCSACEGTGKDFSDIPEAWKYEDTAA